MSRSFDGVDDIISFGTTGDKLLTENSPVTCAAWILPDNTGEGGSGVIFIRGVSIVSPGLIFRSINTIRFRVQGTTDLIRASSDSEITMGIWQHVAFTWDGSTTAANVHIYVNGVETGYQTTTNGATPTNNSTENFRVGNLLAAHSFDGLMSYVHGYNRVLSIGEISQIMFYPGSITNGLLGFWPLWGSSPEPDYSGNKNDGTVTGAIFSANSPPINGIFQVPRPQLSGVC